MENFNQQTYREQILSLLRTEKEEVAKDLIKRIAREEFLEQGDIPGLYEFFSPLFDDIFYDLMFEKVRITTSTKLLLERLALPLERVSEEQRQKILKKVG